MVLLGRNQSKEIKNKMATQSMAIKSIIFFHRTICDGLVTYIDQWLKGVRCDMSAELISTGFSRPNFNVHFENHG